MIKVTDHAFVRFLERSGALDVVTMRQVMQRALERGRTAAERAGIADYVISADGLKYVVRDGVVVTVLDQSMPVRPMKRPRR